MLNESRRSASANVATIFFNKNQTAFCFGLAAGGCRAALSEPPIVSPAVIDRELLGEEAAIQVCSITAGAFSLICLLSGAHLRSDR